MQRKWIDESQQVTGVGIFTRLQPQRLVDTRRLANHKVMILRHFLVSVSLRAY